MCQKGRVCACVSPRVREGPAHPAQEDCRVVQAGGRDRTKQPNRAELEGFGNARPPFHSSTGLWEACLAEHI